MFARAATSVAVIITLAALDGAVAQTASQPPDTMAARVEACTPCHGNKGEGTSDVYFPRLAGKPAGYLYNQLLAFRSGRRKYPPMNYLLEFLPDPYLEAMAEYFAGEHPPLPQPAPSEVSKDVLALGEQLATSGDAGRNIPACVSCHGPGLAGMQPGIPGLLGLRANYISAQLGAALRHPHGEVARLHAACRRPSDRGRRHRSRRPACDTPGPCKPCSCPERHLRAALRVRQSAQLTRRMMGSKLSIALLALAALTPAAQAQDKSSDIIARGEYLARAGDCTACHTAPEGRLFAGGRAMPTPFGTLYTSNITPDPDTGIGKWSADDFYKTMHSGRFPDGGLIYPAMPFASYTKVTRADSDAIYAYLRVIAPVSQKNKPHELRFPTTTGSSSRDGARCSSARASSSPIRRNRRNGIAALIWSKASAIAACAIRQSTRSAAPRNRMPSRAA